MIENTSLFPPSLNPLDEICTILARGYIRLLATREKEKVPQLDQDRDNAENLVNPLDLSGNQR